MSWVQLIGSESIRDVDAIEPPLRLQYRLSVLSVVIQYCFQVSFVMIHVSLRADECSVQSYIDLFEERLCQIVDWKNGVRCYQISIVRNFQIFLSCFSLAMF